ncbi:MAG: cytochrome-c peroxidase [Myxococcales bacterium]|nr:cytochrome-c peroxidase [Myxococcales bacterium]
MQTPRLLLAAAAWLPIATAACSKPAEPPPPTEPAQPEAPAEPGVAAEPEKPARHPALGAFQPLPEEMGSPDNPVTPEKITLGRMLYFDARLSKNHDVSCNSCHGLDTYGVDSKPTSSGHKGQLGGRNAPTVYNAGGHLSQFWDGRAKDLEEQAKGPPLNPIEMAMADAAAVEKVLTSIPGYEPLFKAAFPGEEKPITFDNMAKAIGAFERKLLTPSKWDDYLKGNDDALNDAEKAGFAAFIDAGCQACHSGPYVGGGLYQKLGLIKPWPNQKDQGRFDVTKNEGEKMMFKVSSLRNIEKTAPYFHDGSEASLDNAIKMMASHQSGKELDAAAIASIKTFLATLTGPLPEDYIKQPALPESGPDTPKPDPS